MTLTTEFNSKAQVKRRASVETETIGAHSLSRYFCAVAVHKRVVKSETVVVKPVIVAAPVLIRRGMNI